jgi:hypothetical protein
MMAKPKSKKLLEYLNRIGALNGTAEQIQLAKIQYRKEYQKNWKQTKATLIKDLRITLSLREYKDLKVFVYDLKKSPTAYSKQIILQSITGKKIIPNRSELELIYQKVGMAINQNLKDHSNIKLLEALIKIEEDLSNYLNSHEK